MVKREGSKAGGAQENLKRFRTGWRGRKLVRWGLEAGAGMGMSQAGPSSCVVHINCSSHRLGACGAYGAAAWPGARPDPCPPLP